MIVKLLGYMPDADPTVLGALMNCSGVIPSLRGMKGAPSPVGAGFATLAGTVHGAATLYKLDNSTRLIVGSPTKLYEGSTSTWADVSRATSYTTTTTQRWRFAQFGDVSLAANGCDTMQASVSSGAFSDIGGAPIANIVETVGAFVFGFNVAGTPHQWQCAGINGYTSWTPSTATQATTGTLTATPGAITAGRRFGSNIIAYKRNSMYLGTYVGTPNVWQFDQIPGSAGALSHESVASIGTAENPKHVFMGEDDFYIYDGSKPVPIGNNRVRSQVFSTINQARYYACATLHDRVNALVYFYYPVADLPYPDHCVVYNYRVDRWGVDDRQIRAALDFVAPSVTYDGIGSLYATYDNLPNNTYDLSFAGTSQSVPAIFTAGNILQTVTGPAGTTSYITGDIGDDEQFNCLSRVRPRFIQSPTSASQLNSYRNNLGDVLTADQTAILSSYGTFDALADARWHRLTHTFQGDWEMAVFDVEYASGGYE